jgi:hypothetical protein
MVSQAIRERCFLCKRRRGSGYDPESFTLAEWRVLVRRTGWARGGQDERVVEALWLRRSGDILLPWRRRPLSINWDVLALRCPWSLPDSPRILTPGPCYEFGPDGIDSYPPGWKPDEQGNFCESIGCPGIQGGENGGPPADFLLIRPFHDPSLPRRRVGGHEW